MNPGIFGKMTNSRSRVEKLEDETETICYTRKVRKYFKNDGCVSKC